MRRDRPERRGEESRPREGRVGRPGRQRSSFGVGREVTAAGWVRPTEEGMEQCVITPTHADSRRKRQQKDDVTPGGAENSVYLSLKIIPAF